MVFLLLGFSSYLTSRSQAVSIIKESISAFSTLSFKLWPFVSFVWVNFILARPVQVNIFKRKSNGKVVIFDLYVNRRYIGTRPMSQANNISLFISCMFFNRWRQILFFANPNPKSLTLTLTLNLTLTLTLMECLKFDNFYDTHFKRVYACLHKYSETT